MGMYDPTLVEPMRAELRERGVTELTTPAEVESFARGEGVRIIFVNSVCGCAAGCARPGLIQAIAAGLPAERTGTVFAGMDIEAVSTARALWSDWPPSSPQFGILRDGKAVAVVQRHEVETSDAQAIGETLLKAYEHFNSTQGSRS